MTCFLESLISLEYKVEWKRSTPGYTIDVCPGVMNTYILPGRAHVFSKRIRLVVLGICKSRLSPSCFIRCCQWVCCLHPWWVVIFGSSCTCCPCAAFSCYQPSGEHGEPTPIHYRTFPAKLCATAFNPWIQDVRVWLKFRVIFPNAMVLEEMA